MAERFRRSTFCPGESAIILVSVDSGDELTEIANFEAVWGYRLHNRRHRRRAGSDRVVDIAGLLCSETAQSLTPSITTDRW